jgi:hypothetical protein
VIQRTKVELLEIEIRIVVEIQDRQSLSVSQPGRVAAYWLVVQEVAQEIGEGGFRMIVARLSHITVGIRLEAVWVTLI